MDLLQTILALIVTIGILVTVHEYGHLLVARWCNVRVLKFSVGMGPSIWSRRAKSGIEYSIAALPIGGYVRMLDEREGGVTPEERQYAFNAKTPWQRIAIALGGPVANLLLAIAVYWLISVTGASGFAPVIGDVPADSPLGRAGVPANVEIVELDGQPTPTWQALNMRLVRRLGDSGEIELVTRRPGSDRSERHVVTVERWLTGMDDPNLITELGLRPFPAVLGEVVADGAAERADLRAGDRILAVNGVAVDGWREWVERVQLAPGEALDLEVDRAGRTLAVTLTPEPRTLDDGREIGFVGTGPIYRMSRFGVIEALPRAVGQTWETTVLTLEILRKMVTGLVSTRNLSGPITIAKVAGDSAQSGLETFLAFLALLSVSLAVLNLLPIPVLDGGHILYCVVELIKGSPVSERVQQVGAQIGIVLVAGLMLLAVYNDIARL
ncbi:MAG: RIP metalloprotease RseP [Gammaproteobacteria bacterium]|nr:MAG: RIP metalloprotease RseP [Gammaproteobacteria bacterium]